MSTRNCRERGHNASKASALLDTLSMLNLRVTGNSARAICNHNREKGHTQRPDQEGALFQG